MNVWLEYGLSISALTSAKLGRFTLVAESSKYVYYAVYTEGSAFHCLVIPHIDNEQVKSRMAKLERIALRYQPMMDDIMLAEDYPAFKEGKPAPIAADRYWILKKALESETVD